MMSTERGVSVLVVEADWLVKRGVQKALKSEGYVVTVVSVAEHALRAVEQHAPDIAIINTALAGSIDGIELACQLRAGHGVPAIFITVYTEQNMQRAVRAAPLGCIAVPFTEHQLLGALQLASAALPNRHLRHGQVDDVARLFGDGASPRSREGLTAREREVLRGLLANGRVVSIAAALGVSPHTVRNHLRSIFQKLGVHSQVELIRKVTGALAPDDDRHGSRPPGSLVDPAHAPSRTDQTRGGHKISVRRDSRGRTHGLRGQRISHSD